ncbi:hypothetical protein E2C01_017346 [Portunus trituberculatus]|uniref:Uncharacterized protein n=1 Tax=Portunus trituberculatus TaxID=210409 RepID=A0A5B7DT45_PORTR|nr:hypothetical protein [Portunus trituberculatus]
MGTRAHDPQDVLLITAQTLQNDRRVEYCLKAACFMWHLVYSRGQPRSTDNSSRLGAGCQISVLAMGAREKNSQEGVADTAPASVVSPTPVRKCILPSPTSGGLSVFLHLRPMLLAMAGEA